MNPDVCSATVSRCVAHGRQGGCGGFCRRMGLVFFAAVGWAMTFSVPSGAQPLSFDPPLSYPTGDNPQAIAVADLNQDEEADLVIANSGSNNVWVHPGNGDASFLDPALCDVGTTPVAVAISDLNGDGKPDIVVANADSDDVSVLLGAEAGPCNPGTSIPTGNGPYSVAIGDFNLDQKPDLATANFFGNSVSILLGDGTGAFSPRSDLARDRPVGKGAASVAIGDLNGDEKPDVVVANFYNDRVAILLGDGTGDFGPPIEFNAGPGPTFVAIRDLNSDDKPDLAVATAYAPAVSLLFGDGLGSFAAPTTVSVLTGPQSIEIGDFNGDGLVDLAVAYTLQNVVSILPGNGAGNFGPAMHCIGGSGLSSFDLLASGHFNQDDALDLAVVNSNSDTVSILLNTTDSAPPPAAAPDLLVSQLSASVSGSTILIGDTQQNIGAQAAGAFSVAFSFASNPTSPAGGTSIGTRSLTGLAANGAVNTASTSFAIPANTPTGTYHVCAITDSGGAVNEADKTNNSRCTTQTYPIGPDLTVSSVSASLAGTYITVSDVERNIGNRWADPSVVSFYFAANPNAPTAGTLIGTRSVSGINGGSQYNSATTRFAIPDATPTGTYYVCAVGDSAGVVAELNEGNNTRCAAGTFTIGPDLIVSALTAVKSGGTLYVIDTQRNLGNRRAEPFTVSFYLSFNTVLDAGDTPLGSRDVPSLSGGGAYQSKTTPFPIPSGLAAGGRYLLAISDSGTVVTEWNEANNSKYSGPYPIP